MTSPSEQNERPRDPTDKNLIGQVHFPRLKDYIIQATGLHYFLDKENDLAERIGRRMTALKLSDCDQYLRRLEGVDGKHELDMLVAELTIGETYFFRHTEQFDGMREIIVPEILERNCLTKHLRIWSAGSSSGAEAYTVSILLRTHFAEQLRDWDVSILGTDINRDFLEIARAGAYDEWAFRGTPAELRQRCFTHTGKKWALKPEFKQGVTFQHHNLITDSYPPASHLFADFDIILCRNVVIYFSSDDFRKIVDKFARCLTNKGWLLVGHSEPNTEYFGSYAVIPAPGAILYQKKSLLTAVPDSEPEPTSPHSSATFELPTWVVPKFDYLSSVPPPDVPSSGITSKADSPLPVPRPTQRAPSLKKSVIEITDVQNLANQGLWEEAAASCKTLLAHDNLNSDAQLLMALILEHLDRPSEYEQALRRAIYLDRGSALAHFHMGLWQRKNLDFSGAARSFETVLHLLSRMSKETRFANADGMTAVELQHVVEMQKEALRACEKRSTGTR